MGSFLTVNTNDRDTAHKNAVNSSNRYASNTCNSWVMTLFRFPVSCTLDDSTSFHCCVSLTLHQLSHFFRSSLVLSWQHTHTHTHNCSTSDHVTPFLTIQSSVCYAYITPSVYLNALFIQRRTFGHLHAVISSGRWWESWHQAVLSHMSPETPCKVCLSTALGSKAAALNVLWSFCDFDGILVCVLCHFLPCQRSAFPWNFTAWSLSNKPYLLHILLLSAFF